MDLNYTSSSMNSTVLAITEVSQSNGLPTQFVRFWAYMVSDIASLICTFFALYFLLGDRNLRRALYNHVIIVLLIIGLIYELTNIPWMLYNDYNHEPLIRSRIFYQIWIFINYPFYSVQVELFAWATIERHILIFHDQWVSTRKKRFFVHYFPIGAIIIYYIVYDSVLYFVLFCDSAMANFLAGSIHIPCVFDHTVLGLWDLIFHQVFPTLIIVFGSIGLFVRSILQKSRLRQGVNWRKHRKMIIQLLTISTIYFMFNAPWVLVIFTFQYGLPLNVAVVLLAYTGFLFYYVIFLFPFVCFLSLPELRKKFKTNLLRYRRTRQVGTTTVTTGRMPGNRTNGPARTNI